MSSFKIIQIQHKKMVCVLKFYAPDNLFCYLSKEKLTHKPITIWVSKRFFFDVFAQNCRNVFVRWKYYDVCVYFSQAVDILVMIWNMWNIRFVFFRSSFSIQYANQWQKFTRASTIEFVRKEFDSHENRAHVLTAQTFTSPLTRNAQ